MPAATLARVDEISAAAVDRAASTFLSTVSSATCEQATIAHTQLVTCVEFILTAVTLAVVAEMSAAADDRAASTFLNRVSSATWKWHAHRVDDMTVPLGGLAG
jgi:hypothetical protein